MILYNTLTRQKEELTPRDGKKIRMFVCGPTVYDYIHIGNARTFVVFDMVAKYLRHKGYQVEYIQNITDIEDKIIVRAQETGQEPFQLAKDFENKFYEDTVALGVDSVSRYAPASDHIPEVIRQVKKLIDTGHAYLIDGDGWYFDLSTFPEYGKLSGRTAEMADDAVSQIDENPSKRNRGDFALWKLSKTDEPSWPSELGAGRPGWHIEDTAITEKYFGPQYDLHGGGQDLIFPHHEAEITQQESASGLKPFVKYWMHVGFLVNKDKKMSKSLGNFATARELIQKYPKEVLRFYLLSGYYRSPLDYSQLNLNQAEAAVARIGQFIQRMKVVADQNTGADAKPPALIQRFEEKMDDDFNTPEAIAAIFETVKEANIVADNGQLGSDTAKSILDQLVKINRILGIIPEKPAAIPAEIMALVKEREELRQTGNFTAADQVRKKILDRDFEIEDTVYGPLVKEKI